MAITVGSLNIRVNGIAPGIVQTEFSKAVCFAIRRYFLRSKLLSFQLWEEEDAAKFHKDNIPLGRMADSDDCAGAVSFLCSEDAKYITGDVIVIAGGINARL